MKTVMNIKTRLTAQLILAIRERDDKTACLYRISAWMALGDDGSQVWSIRDYIDPAFVSLNEPVVKRAEAAREWVEEIMTEDLMPKFTGQEE